MVFLLFGGNDFACAENSSGEVSVQLLALAALLHGGYNVNRIVVGRILPRFTDGARQTKPALWRAKQPGPKVSVPLYIETAGVCLMSRCGITTTLSFSFPSNTREGSRRLCARDRVYLSDQGQYQFVVL